MSQREGELAKLRRELLKTEGFISGADKGKVDKDSKPGLAHKKNSPAPKPYVPETVERSGKSREMLKLEKRHKQSIEMLLAGDKWAKDIAEELGISVSTVSNWRKRLSIESEYSMNKLMMKVKDKIDEHGGS